MTAQPDRPDLATRYEWWRTERARISALEAEGTYPNPDEWANSDDEAVELLHEAIQALNPRAGTP